MQLLIKILQVLFCLVCLICFIFLMDDVWTKYSKKMTNTGKTFHLGDILETFTYNKIE